MFYKGSQLTFFFSQRTQTMASADNPINTDVPEKDVFALHFLQTLSNLRTQNRISSLDKTSDRVKKIKKAAYVSMARAAGGTDRLWSRALLHRAAKRNSKNVRSPRRRKRVTWLRKRTNRRHPVEEVAAERLRNLVPGGGEMETSKLMEETAHYIKCLSMQVRVMQCLVDGLSPKWSSIIIIIIISDAYKEIYDTHMYSIGMAWSWYVYIFLIICIHTCKIGYLHTWNVWICISR